VVVWLSGRRAPIRFHLVDVITLIPALSVLVLSFAGIVLAELGVFEYSLAVIVVLAVAAGLSLTARSARMTIEWPSGWRVQCAFLAALVIVMGLLYFRPHEYVFGGWDPSVYVNTGASIERTGGILYKDEAFASVPPETQRAFVHRRQGIDQRFPGMLIADPERGLITPQFHHLYPTWLAVFRRAGGDTAMLYAAPLFGLISVLVLFALCRRFLPTGAAFAAAILFALNVAQVWQARFPTSEMLAQLCILTMLYLLLLYFETGSIVAAVLSALALDMALQTRFDSLLLVPMLAVVVYARNLRAWQRRDWILVVGGAVALAHVVLHSLFISFLYRPGLPLLKQHLTVVVAVVAVLVVVAVVLFAAFRRWPERLTRFATGPVVRGVVIALILVGAFFAYFVRPMLGAGSADTQNFVAFGWLLTPVGLALAVAGACLLVGRARTSGELALLVVGLVVTVVYVKSALIEDFFMWRVRRFVPVVIPMLCLFAGYGLSMMTAPLKRWRPVACGAVALVLVGVPMAQHRAILTTRDYAGAVKFVDEVAEQLDPDGVYICNHYWLAMPLRMQHGFETYAVSDPTPGKWMLARQSAEEQIAHGRRVYFVDEDRPHIFPGVACVPATPFSFVSRRLEHSKGRLPTATEPVRLDAVVYELVPLDDAPDDTANVDLTWEFEPGSCLAGDGFQRGDIKKIKIVETSDGERLDPTPDTPADEISYEYAWLTGRRSALWIPHDPARAYTAELRVSTHGVEHGTRVGIGDHVLATLEPGQPFHTVVVEIPPGIETGTSRRAQLQFVSLAPDDYDGPRGSYIDRLRLLSVVPSDGDE